MRPLLSLAVIVFVALVPLLASAQPIPADQEPEPEADPSEQSTTSETTSSDSETTSKDSSQESQDQEDASGKQPKAQADTRQTPQTDQPPVEKTEPSTPDRETSADTSDHLFEDFPFQGYGAAEYVLADAAGNVGSYFGGRGGVIFDELFVLGLGGYGLLGSPDDVPRVEGHRPVIGASYGGPFFEVLFFPERPVHGRAGIMTGFGSVSFTTDSQSLLSRKVDNGFFFFDPYVSAEADLTSFMQAGAGIGWRATMGAQLPGLDDSDLSSPTGRLYLKFGSF